MAPAVSSVALATGVTLSYAAVGDPSAPAVVLLPGPTDSWPSYEPVLGQLPQSIRAIAVSQRGHGDSDKPPNGYHVEHFAGDVPPLLDELGIERAVLAGHSGSCLVARRTAIDHPERVSGLVLEACPATLSGHRGLEELVTSVLPNLHDPIDPTFARSFVTDTSSERVSPHLVDRLTSEVMKVPSGVWTEMFSALSTYDDLDELDRITAPVLLLWGDRDGLVDREMQAKVCEVIRWAKLIVYHGVGHAPRWEDPARFAADVTTFVTSLDE